MRRALALLLSALCFGSTSSSQWNPTPGSPLVAPTYLSTQADDGFGRAISISSNGMVALVGAPLRDVVGPTGELVRQAGEVFLYRRFALGDAFEFVENITAPLASVHAGAGFGTGICVSAGGSYSFVGGPSLGFVSIVKLSGYTLEILGPINSPAGNVSDEFGVSLSVTAAGNILAVGAPSGGASGAGAAYVCAGNPAAPPSMACQEIPPPVTNDTAAFGYSVALADNVDGANPGGTVIVGAPGHGTGPASIGAAFAYSRQYVVTPWADAAMAILTPNCTAQPLQPCAAFGTSVAVSGDGWTAAVGAPSCNSTAAAGRVVVFENNGTQAKPLWLCTAELLPSDPLSLQGMGSSIDINKDGDVIVVTSRNASSAAVFAKVGPATPKNTWVQIDALAPNSSGLNIGRFGAGGASMDKTGETILIGSPAADAADDNVTYGGAFSFDGPGFPGFPSPSATATASGTATASASATVSGTVSATATSSSSASATASASFDAAVVASSTASSSSSSSPTASASATSSVVVSEGASPSTSPIVTSTSTSTLSATTTATATSTATNSSGSNGDNVLPGPSGLGPGAVAGISIGAIIGASAVIGAVLVLNTRARLGVQRMIRDKVVGSKHFPVRFSAMPAAISRPDSLGGQTSSKHPLSTTAFTGTAAGASTGAAVIVRLPAALAQTQSPEDLAASGARAASIKSLQARSATLTSQPSEDVRLQLHPATAQIPAASASLASGVPMEGRSRGAVV